jgi:PAS domain S-box-containing protein
MFKANGITATPPAARDATASMRRLRPLLELANLVRGERDLGEALESIAGTIAEGVGWKTVVVNLYRRAWDDFEVTTVHGNAAARAALLGTTSEWHHWEPLLDPRFERAGAYVVRRDDLDWAKLELPTFVPDAASRVDPAFWHAEDSLVVPLAHTHGRLLGILSIDEPESGLAPTDEELELLAAMAAQAAHAVEQQQLYAETRRNRAALEHLHEVSMRLSAISPPQEVLAAVTTGIRDALDFEKVTILLRDGDALAEAASCGWDEGELTIRMPARDLDTLLDPLFETEGCFLIPCESALERCSSGSDYESRLNGRGPWAWNRHWLLVPFRTESGEVMGMVWADDPADRLLPSAEKLRVLRMFSNQAATALELARTFAAEHEATEMMRAIVASSPLATIRVDANGFVRAWNAAAEELYGWRAEEMLGRRYGHETGAEQLEFAHVLAPVLAGESFRGLEVVRQTRDGRRVDVSISAAPVYDSEGANVVGAVYVHEDIGGRKRAARALAQSQELYRSVVETLSDVITLLELDGTVVFASRAVEDVLGLRPDEIASRNLGDLIHPDDREHAFAALDETIRTGRSPVARVRAKHSDGRWVNLEATATAVLDDGGAPCQVLGIVREVGPAQ